MASINQDKLTAIEAAMTQIAKQYGMKSYKSDI